MPRPPRDPVAGGRLSDQGPPPRRRTWILLLILLAGVFAGLRALSGPSGSDDVVSFATDRVVVVGVEGLVALSDTDRALIGARLDQTQIGSVAIRPRYVGDCAAAGWTTLGAGRRAAVGDLCTPGVDAGRVVDWSARQQAAAADRGDAHLGTLAGSIPGCVAAVGPGAALAAAEPDGTVADYRTLDAFVADGHRTTCPITLVDAGADPGTLIPDLAADDEVTVIVTGIGPPAGSDDPSLQVIYRFGTTLPGLLTSASTRRVGIVTLTDLTRTLIDVGAPAASPPLTVDGSPLAVRSARLTLPAIDTQLSGVRALSDQVPGGYLVLGLSGAVVVAAIAITAVRRRWRAASTLAVLPLVLSAVMMLVGAVPWARSSTPLAALGGALALWWIGLTAAALGLARALRVPAGIAAAGLTVAAFTVDAALGGPMQPGSLLNSRPIFGLRWYGFGNVTFAAYATAGLVVAGYVAHRMRLAGRPRAALVAVAAIGLGVVVCEGWPSMGSDFGGVIALMPALVWLVFALSGTRVGWLKLLLVGVSAVVAITAISVLDWRRGPDRRSHLGNFVQRVVDGDAIDVVARKAVASIETLGSPMGIVTLVVGIPVWIALFRWGVPALTTDFSTIRPTAWAVLIAGVLGTVLNDGGISVLLTATSSIALTVAWWLFDRERRKKKESTFDNR